MFGGVAPVGHIGLGAGRMDCGERCWKAIPSGVGLLSVIGSSTGGFLEVLSGVLVAREGQTSRVVALR